jgi:hypothetical protein
VGTTGGGIHLCGANRSIHLAFIHLFLDGLITVHGVLREILHVHSELLVLTNLETTLRAGLRVNQQVLGLFVVDFDHGELDLKLESITLLLTDSVEDLVAGNWHDTEVLAISDLCKISIVKTY